MNSESEQNFFFSFPTSPYTEKSSRQPKCFRCRNHGREILIKGHKMHCPFRNCSCMKCALTKAEMEVMAKSVAMRRRMDEYRRNRFSSSYTKSVSVQTPSYWNNDESGGSLSQDLSKLLDSDSNKDIEIKCGSHSMRAHKTILCARSNVFDAMLRHDMQERRSGVVEIHDVDAGHLQDFIRYLYTEELPNMTFEKAEVLYEIGNRFDVKSLLHHCAEYLQEHLSPGNIGRYIVLADAVNDQKLKDMVVTYILEKQLLDTYEIWLLLFENYPDIFREVSRLRKEGADVNKSCKYVQTTPCRIVGESRGSLARDFSQLLDSEVAPESRSNADLLDAELKFGNYSVKVHKIILYARSDILKIMMEDQKKILEIPNMDVNSCKDFIRYVYTDILPELTPEKAMTLHKAGLLYDIKNLSLQCLRYLQEEQT